MAGFPRARLEPEPGWYLISVPLLLILVGGSRDPTSVMLRLAAVLLLGMLAWGMGRGPAGRWTERSFAALLLLAWFAVCAKGFGLQEVPDPIPARLAVAAALLLGPVVLLWAWRRRARMVPMGDAAGVAARGPVAALIPALVLVALALLLLDRFFRLPPVDLLVIGTGMALFATFRVRGRRSSFGVPV